MLDLTMDEKNKPYFITDIEYDEKEIRVTRADGRVEVEPFSAHNLGFHRTKMIENAKENIGPYMDELSKDTFFTVVKRYGSIIVDILGLFLLYNVDIHVIIKILITALVVLGELAYLFFNWLYLGLAGNEVMECLALEYYLNNLSEFTYDDSENFTTGYYLAPEDISRYGLTKEHLEAIVENKSRVEDNKDIFEGVNLGKERKPENGKSML